MSAPNDALARDLRAWWFASIHDLSDIVLQRRTWLDPTNRNPHWSYIEFVCSYPDDDQLQDARQKGGLTADEFLIMSDLRRNLVAHSAPGGNDYDNAAVLDDPAWHSVVETAERAKQQLLRTITDPRERAALEGKINT